jgi:hypothetical protein
MVLSFVAIIIVHVGFVVACFVALPYPYNYYTAGGAILLGVASMVANMTIFDCAAKNSASAEKCIDALVKDNDTLRRRLTQTGGSISVDAVEMGSE